MSEYLAVEQVARILEQNGYRRVSPELSVGESFSFDAVLVADDPQPIVIVEYKSTINPKAFRDYVRKLQSLVWAVYAQGKQHSITAILIVEAGMTGEELEAISSQLVGTCRVFILPADFTVEQLSQALFPLSRPFAPGAGDAAAGSAGVVDALTLLRSGAEESKVTELLRLSHDCRNASEVTARLTNEFLKRIRELEDALTEPEV